MPSKVIHLYGRVYETYYPPIESEKFYWSSWASQIAERTKEGAPEWDMELWRADRDVAEPRLRECARFRARLFPSVRRRYWGECSPLLSQSLRDEAHAGPVILHHHSIHSRRLYQALLALRGQVPVVAQNHGDMRPFCGGNKIGGSILDYCLERLLFRRVEHFFYLRKEERRYLDRISPRAGKSFLPVGVDFDRFKPSPKDEAKRKLGLEPKRKVLLYVGYLYELKGVHLILEGFRILRQKHNLSLLLVGGRPEDPLYDLAKGSGAVLVGRVSHDAIIDYFNAADAYIVPAFKARGYDVSSIEAAACDVPSVSTYLQELPAADAKDLGLAPTVPGDVIPQLDCLLSRLGDFRRCRETAAKHFSWPHIAARISDVYRTLMQRHPGYREDSRGAVQTEVRCR